MIVLHSHYCHRSALYREYKRQTGSTLSEKSFNRYLVRWQKEGEIYSAGRNWYSDLQDEFKLFTRPLTELNDFLAEEFPLQIQGLVYYESAYDLLNFHDYVIYYTIGSVSFQRDGAMYIQKYQQKKDYDGVH